MSIVPQFLEGAAFGVMNDIISTFHSKDGYAQPNRYEVLIFPPTKPASGGENLSRGDISQISSKDKREISLRCESITLPGRNLSTTGDTNYHGPVKTIVNNVNYDDSVKMVFQSSSDLRERVFFEKWQYAAFNPKTWNVGYYNDYVGSVFIYLLDKQDQRKYGLKLWEAFPKSIALTDLSYAGNNEIIKLTVDMKFRYWSTLDITQETPSLNDKIGQTITDVIQRNITRAIPSVLRNLP